MKNIILLAIAGLGLASCNCVTKVATVQAKSNTSTSGEIKFAQKANTVTMDINVSKLTPGLHAVHIHEMGDCSATDASSAGGHWNPEKSMHGKWEGEHFHMGDIGNLNADTLGNATLTFKTDKWCLGCDDPAKNIIGKSIVIHQIGRAHV